jgi:DNA polymerase-3 subunit gamma/tau
MSDDAPSVQTLYRVYRPRTFDGDELVGQEHVTRTLKSAIRHARLAHAYLFCGPRGTGKTSTARLLAKAANCLNPDPDRRPCNECEACRAINAGRTMDIIEIDAASNRGIDEIRALRDTVQLNPAQLRYRFYIIDECHQLTPPAWNAFLKTLEEPPPHAKFVLCTTEPEKLLDTVASRCQRFDFHRISVEAMTALMRAICAREGLLATDEALGAIARQATGSMRDALSLLDTLAAYGTTGEGITLETVHNVLGAGSNERVLAIIDAIAANEVGAGIAAINAATEVGVEPGVLAGQIVSALRALLYAAYAVPGTRELVDDALRERVGRMAPAEIAYITKLFSQVEFRLKHTAYGQLPLELAVVDAVLMRTGQLPAAPATPAAQSVATMPAPTPIVDARPTRPVAVRPAAAPPAEDSAPVRIRPDRMRPERAAPPSRPDEPTAPSPTPVEAPMASGTLTVEQIDGLWNRIRQAVRMEGRTKTAAVLTDVNPDDVRGNMIVLRTSHTFHQKHINEEETKLFLERVIGQVVGQPVRVICEAVGAPGGGAAARNGRTRRPAEVVPPGDPPSAVQTPLSPPPNPPTPLRPSNPSNGVAQAADADLAVADSDDALIRKISNLYDARELPPEEAPPFPEKK